MALPVSRGMCFPWCVSAVSSAKCPFCPVGDWGRLDLSSLPRLWVGAEYGVARSSVQRTRQCHSPAPRQPWAVSGSHGVAASSRGQARSVAGRSRGVQPHLKVGLVPTSIFSNLSWRPPRHHSLSPGDLKHSEIHRHPSPPLLPCCPSLPVLRWPPAAQGRWQNGCAIPGGCSSPVGSIGSLSCLQLPRAAGGCGGGKGLTFQGQAAIGSAAGKPSLADWVTSTQITKTSEI